MARQGRYDQHRRLAFEVRERFHIVSEAFEANQIAKRLVDFSAFVDADFNVAHFDGLDAKLGLHIVFAQAVHQVVASRDALHQRVLGEGRFGVAQNF